MKTKNFFSIASLIICGLVCVVSVNAQKTDNVTLNIKFQPIQSIVVAGSQKEVNLVYASKNDYANGVQSEQQNHLTVFSTGGFQVSVSTDKDNFERAGGGTIPVKDVIVKANTGTKTNSATHTFPEVALSKSPQALITADAGGNELTYNVTYDNTAAGSGYKYINNYIHDDSETLYTATVTYTIATN